ncbi:hypothetical protein U1Q18_022733 [Sarracenia purpurea var. burkii]
MFLFAPECVPDGALFLRNKEMEGRVLRDKENVKDLPNEQEANQYKIGGQVSSNSAGIEGNLVCVSDFLGFEQNRG